MKEFKDLFSRQATQYSHFRPTYPNRLFDYLSSLILEHDLAWDCATGNGQAAVKLTEYFEQVIATDLSKKQLMSAQPHPKIQYQMCAAEKSPLLNQSVNLITVAQALHWFKHEDFFNEARRVLKPGGIIAFWCYVEAHITPEIDAVVQYLYRDILRNCWEPERKWVDANYSTVQLPFEEIVPPKFDMAVQWTLDQLMGYLSTWSAVQTYIQKNHSNPLDRITQNLCTAWGNAQHHSVHWDIALRVGRA